MILDLIIVVILAFSAYIGYKKGFVGIAVSLVALILSIALAVLLQGSVATYIYNETTIGSTIENSITTTLETYIENKQEENFKESNFIDMFFDTEEIVDELVEENSNKLTMFILKGISFVGIFIIVSIICYILSMILNIVFKLPILNSINKIGGVSLNIVKTVFKIWVLLAIISFVVFVPAFEFIHEFIDSSIVTKFLYENNIIVNILKSTLGL